MVARRRSERETAGFVSTVSDVPVCRVLYESTVLTQDQLRRRDEACQQRV